MTSTSTRWHVDQAISALLSARQRVLMDDPDLAADENAIADALGETTDDLSTALRAAVRGAIAAEQRVREAKAMIDRLAARKQRYERRAETLRGAIFAAMDVLGHRRIEEADFLVTLKAGRAGLYISDEAAIPAEYKVTTTTLDRAALMADLNEGVVIDGAGLGNVSVVLTIRSK